MITTEGMLVSLDGFGITTATPAQRAACRVLDGLPLEELRQHPDAVDLVGGEEAFATLSSERGEQPTEVVFLASIRSAKTIVACAAALRMTQTVDVSKLGPGEVPRVSIVSLKLDTSAAARSILIGTIKASELLSGLLVDAAGETIVMQHPSGRHIEIATVAGAKAGGGLVARWSAGAIFDEAPRMSGQEDSVVNLDDARSAVLGRLLPGAQALYIGSAWAPYGPIYELVQEHWRKPKPHLVVLRGTGPMLNPVWWTPARCEKLQEQDPVAYQTDVLGEFADPESGLLNPFSVRGNTRADALELPPSAGALYVAAIDPSGGGASGNAWTLVIVQRIEGAAPNEPPRFRVALAREWRGLRPEQCLEQIAKLCKRYWTSLAHTDQYAGAANADLARRFGLELRVWNTTAGSKLKDFTDLATLIHSDRVELAPDKALERDLLSVRKRVTQQGQTIVLPRTGDGRHCDYAPALCAAVKHAASGAAYGFDFDDRVISAGYHSEDFDDLD